MADQFKGKILLITGGTGSFGSAVVGRFLKTKIKEIRIFSRDEKKQEDMRNKIKNDRLKFYIGDVRNLDSLVDAFNNVDYVFHAAALKQVPSCEFYPYEAVRTNTIGTENVLNASILCKVQKLILLSTDKAVYPINSMGLSKAMAEKLLIAKSRLQHSTKTVMCATRYGNVLASRGSIVPLLVSKIKKGEKLTITDPEMTRFIMTLKDSVELVLFAFKNGKSGDIFVQKAPACTVKNLSKAVKEIFKKESKIDDKIIGTRHGEKLYETLVSREEMSRVIDLKKYYKIPADNRDLNYSKYFIEGNKKIKRVDDYTSHNTRQLSVLDIKKILLSLDYIKREINA